MHKKLLHLLFLALFATTGVTLQAGKTESSDISNVDVSDDFFAKLERINRQHSLQQQLSKEEKRKLEQQMAAEERECAKRREAKKAREEAEYQQNKKNAAQAAKNKKPAGDSQTKKPDARNQPEPRNSYNPHRGHSDNNYNPAIWNRGEDHIIVTPLSDAELAALRASHKKNARKQKRDPKVVYDKIDVLRNDTTVQLENALENDNPHLAQRYENRLNAIEKTIRDGGKEYDYSKNVKTPKFTDPYATLFNNCHGTAIDQQIHEEVCETRSTALEIQSGMPGNFYIDAMVPTVNKLTAQAKIEESCQKAFTFSDAADDLLRVASTGAAFLGNKCVEGAKFFSDPMNVAKGAYGLAAGLDDARNALYYPSTYINLATGVASLAKAVATPANWASAAKFAMEQIEITEAMDSAPTKANTENFLKIMQESQKRDAPKFKVLDDHIEAVMQEIEKQPWEETVRQGVALGTSLYLDNLILGAAGKVAGKAASAAKTKAVKKTKEILQTALKAFSTEEVIVPASMADMAIVAKVAAEEGIEAANKLAEIAHNNPGILTEAMEQSPAVLAKEGKAVAQAINEAATEIERATGTVWDHVKPGAPCYSNTKIPQSMELTAAETPFWLQPSATKHLAEYVRGGPELPGVINNWDKVSHGAGIRSQVMLHSLQSAMTDVVKAGIKYGDKIVLPHIPQWELKFAAKGTGGPLPVLFHACYKPEGFAPTAAGIELANKLKGKQGFLAKIAPIAKLKQHVDNSDQKS